MDYEKKYKEALERAKKLKETCDSTAVIGWCEYIFPELKESESEKIRKQIKAFIKSRGSQITQSKTDAWIAWLEKQSEMNIQNNNPLKIEPDKFYFCIKDYFAGGCYRSKKGDVVLAKNGMNMMGLSLKEASEYFMPINPFNEYVVAWLEKQREKKHVDKVEPKFHEGDWVVSKFDGKARRISEVHCDEYNKYYIVEGKEYNIEEYDRLHRLWTIEDAKDGDVLATKDNHICIFDNTVEEGKYPFAYCGLSIYGFEVYDRTLPFTHLDIYPATKEQCDLLFQRMKDAGYEWNVEKKELKKIEDVPENYKQQDMSEMTDRVKDYIQQKPAWSENDEPFEW